METSNQKKIINYIENLFKDKDQAIDAWSFIIFLPTHNPTFVKSQIIFCFLFQISTY